MGSILIHAALSTAFACCTFHSQRVPAVLHSAYKDVACGGSVDVFCRPYHGLIPLLFLSTGEHPGIPRLKDKLSQAIEPKGWPNRAEFTHEFR